MGTIDGTFHASAGTPDEQDDEGWYRAACDCGFEVTGLPDLETVVDVLMDHAAAAMEKAFTP